MPRNIGSSLFVFAAFGLASDFVFLTLASAATFTVNSTADNPDANPGDGVCATGGGRCTVRAAIDEANARPGVDTIRIRAGTYTVTRRIYIEDSVDIVGNSASDTIVSGGGRSPILQVRTSEYLICDSASNRVFSYDHNGRMNGTMVTNGSGGLRIPGGLLQVRDNDQYGPGDVLVTGYSSGVHRFDGRTGQHEGVLVPSGGNLGMSDSVFGPDGNLYVANYLGGVLKYNGATGASLGVFIPAGSGGLSYPNSLLFSGGSLYVSSVGNNSILKFDAATGRFQSVFVASGSGGLSTPRDLVFAPDGSLLVASWNTHSVLRYHGVTGAFQGALVQSGSAGLNRPTDLMIGADNTLFVISTGATRQVKRYDLSTGAFRSNFVTGSATGPGLNRPSCIAMVTGLGRGPTVNIRQLTLREGRTAVGDGGSALRNERGAVTALHDSIVRDNRSSSFGGAIRNDGALTLLRTEVRNNQLPEGGGGQTSQGGGVFNVGRLILDQSSVTENVATRGGGISNTNAGQVEIRNSTISSNRAFGGGGGIRNVANGSVSIAYSTVAGNRGNEPGGRGEPYRWGGGIQNGTGQVGENPRLRIVGSIIAGNTDNRSRFDAEFSPDCYSPSNSITSEGANLIGVVNTSCTFSPSFDLVGTSNVPLDPVLTALGSNGGTTRTQALNTGSPAIDASVFGDCPAVDQRGVSRPRDGDSDAIVECDIGAYER